MDRRTSPDRMCGFKAHRQLGNNVVANRLVTRTLRSVLAVCVAMSGTIPGSDRVAKCQACCGASGDRCCGCCQRSEASVAGSCCKRHTDRSTASDRTPACCHRSKEAERSAVQGPAAVCSASEAAESATLGFCSCCLAPRPAQPAPLPERDLQWRIQSSPVEVDHLCDELLADMGLLGASLESHPCAPQFSGRTRLLWFCVWRP